MKKTSRRRIQLPHIKKDITLFFSSEEAKILKQDIAKWGLTAAGIAAAMSAASAFAQSPEDGSLPPQQALLHTSATVPTHTSVSVYDPVCQCGGHSSNTYPTHTDSVQDAP
jgi:hypothetical protein